MQASGGVNDAQTSFGAWQGRQLCFGMCTCGQLTVMFHRRVAGQSALSAPGQNKGPDSDKALPPTTERAFHRCL